ncbi:MAG: S-layer homology domain-containing protein [Bacillota bacterium]|nr:S-layer homology domain-containing protein [Bacillota bacterium]
MKKLTAALLTCVLFLGVLVPAALAAGPTDREVIDAALEFLYAHEGNYGSINKNDNGALSVGKIQWHADRALSLIRSVVNSNPGSAQNILGEDLYQEVLTAESWATRVVDQEEAAALSALLSTAEGKAAQDSLAASDIGGYIKRGKNLGITDPAVLVYFADLENQGGYGMSRRVASAAAETVGSFGAITLSDLHQAALADSVAGKYPIRRGEAYVYCRNLGWSAPVQVHFRKTAVYTQGQFSDVATNQWYTGNVAAAVEFGLMKGDSGLFRPTGSVTIAEAVTLAARIHSIYETGKDSFAQSSGGKWYQVYLDYAYQKGLISRSYYTCNVNQKATRAQFAEILSKALPDEALPACSTVADNAIPDVSLSQSWGPAVYKLYRAGILTGDLDGSFRPKDSITRAEAAVIAARMADTDNRVVFTLNRG